jgi:4-carboxymuconolactone decarboxylase
MPRLPNLTDRDQLPEELREAYDRVAAARQGAVSGPYGVLLHSPELAERTAELGNYLRWNSALDARQTETAVLAVAREMDAALMWDAHVRIGLAAGIPQATIDIIAAEGAVDSLDDEGAAIVRYVRELLREHRVQSATFEGVRSRLGDQGVVDLTGLLGYYSIVGHTLNAFEIEPPEGAVRLPPRSVARG